jgi:hypothetical protein
MLGAIPNFSELLRNFERNDPGGMGPVRNPNDPAAAELEKFETDGRNRGNVQAGSSFRYGAGDKMAPTSVIQQDAELAFMPRSDLESSQQRAADLMAKAQIRSNTDDGGAEMYVPEKYSGGFFGAGTSMVTPADAKSGRRQMVTPVDAKSTLQRADSAQLAEMRKSAEFQNILDGGQPTDDIYYNSMVGTLNQRPQNRETNNYVAGVAYTPEAYAPRANFNPLPSINSEFQAGRDANAKQYDDRIAQYTKDLRTDMATITDPSRVNELQKTQLDPYQPKVISMADINQYGADSKERIDDALAKFSSEESKDTQKPRQSLDQIAARFGGSSYFGHKDHEMARLAGYSDSEIANYIRSTGNANPKNRTPGAGGLLDQITGRAPLTYAGKVDIDRGYYS